MTTPRTASYERALTDGGPRVAATTSRTISRLEAARALMRFGFDELGLHRVFLECDPRNTGSVRLAEKLGMQREGLLREHLFIKGEWCDSMYFGILARESPPAVGQ